MPSHTIITLDTRAPTAYLGDPVHGVGEVRVPYSLDEPELVAAEINRAVATIVPSSPTEGELVAPIDLPQGGELEIRATVRDEVWNTELRRWLLPYKPSEGSAAKTAEGRPAPGSSGSAARPDRPVPGRSDRPRGVR